MSAFVVSKTDIDLLVSAMREYKVYVRLNGDCREAKQFDPSELGAMLWAENFKSYNFRYSETASPDAYKFKQYLDIQPGAIAKIAHCYEYQSCEHDEWEMSEARAAVMALEHSAWNRIPAYSAAPWGITNPADLAKVCNTNLRLLTL